MVRGFGCGNGAVAVAVMMGYGGESVIVMVSMMVEELPMVTLEVLIVVVMVVGVV